MAQLASIRHMSGQVSRGSVGEYQAYVICKFLTIYKEIQRLDYAVLYVFLNYNYDHYQEGMG